jgi:hypothetical protein
MLNSVNFFQRPDRKMMNYIAIGQKLVYDRWDIYLDLIHHANAVNDWGKNFAVVSCANLYFKNGLNLFAKGAWEQNKSNEILPGFGIGNSIALGYYDCFAEAGTSYLTYGFGLEYHPQICPDFRIHAFVANRRTTRPGNLDRLTYNENSLQCNVGITWDMDIHRMIKERMAKALKDNKSAIE